MKTVAAIVLLSCAFVAHGFELEKEWNLWKAEYGKKYDCEEMELSRRSIWAANKMFVDAHNANAKLHGYTVKMNEFADLDSAEFAKMYNGYNDILGMKRTGSTYLPSQNVKDLPTSVDWRTKGVVTYMKNQGQCGSCWAFSTTGSLEGQHALKTGKLVSLSEQQLVDCSGSYGNEGCNGGLMDNAFKYIKNNGGIDTDESYPYVAHDEKCRFNPATVGATDTGYVDIQSKNESALQVAVATVGPISCAMDASHLGFQLYHSGVYDPWICSETRLDHGVLAVGYGVDGSKDYWIVKNSWGTSWGQKGYFWLARNKGNKCGIATSSSYPLV